MRTNRNYLITGVEPNAELKPAITYIKPLTKAEKLGIVLFTTTIVYLAIGVFLL